MHDRLDALLPDSTHTACHTANQRGSPDASVDDAPLDDEETYEEKEDQSREYEQAVEHVGLFERGDDILGGSEEIGEGGVLVCSELKRL